MKRPVKLIALILVCALLACSLTGCAKADVSKKIKAFESACQKADVDAMLDCFNPDIVKPVKSVLGLLGISDFNSIADKLLDIIGFIDFKDASPQETLQTLKIKTKDFNFSENDTKCAVASEVTYKVDGEESSKTVVINLKQKDGEWFITGIK